MTDAPLSIFISYSHADSAFVDRIDADLRAQGFDTWVDRERLVAGLRWRRELQEAVERAQVLLIVLSPEAIASPNVQIEYDYALDLGKVVIPVYYRQCNVPMELRAIQWVDFRHSYEQGLAALTQVLHIQQDKATPTHPSEQTRPIDQKEPAATGHPPFNNLPAQLTALIGREPQIQAVCALLHEPEVRLVTLTGTGGVGKTRLGLAVAQILLGELADGACFVSLASISNPNLVAPTIAQVFSLREVGDQSLLEQLKAYLREKQLLLLLDNFEQLLDAAPLLTELLEACPSLQMLVTSRAVLNVLGEHTFPVPPLAVPNLAQLPEMEDLSHTPSVALFLERASAVKSNFEITQASAASIAEICLRLEGLPLAIELAAARIKLFSPQALLSRLSQPLQLLTGGSRTSPARQQTLRSTIQWSYDLLEPEEQTLFRLLSAFVGGWSLEAAEALCQQTGKAHLDVLNTLASLLDNSLIQQSEQEAEEPRFLMLQTVREFGLEMLAARGEREAIRARHAYYFLALAEQAEPELVGSNQALWVARLEQEHDNLREALEWALEEVTGEEVGERTEVALRLSAALKDFWIIHGHYHEARTFLERALAMSEGANASLHNRLLRATGEVADLQGDIDRVEVVAQQILSLSRELGDTRGIANALGLLAGVAMRRGKTGEAVSLHEEKVRLLRQVGEPGEVAEAILHLADLVSIHGEYSRGQALFQEALLLSRQAGNELLVGTILVQSSIWLWFTQGDMTHIQQRLQQGQAIISKLGDPSMMAHCSLVTGVIAASEGQTTRAHDLIQEGLAFFRKADLRWNIAQMLHILGWVEQQKGEMRAARSHYEESLALNRELGEQLNTRYALEGLASVVAAEGELGWAAQLWGAAEALREVMACPMEPVLRASYEQAVSTARAQLGEEAFATAWQEGRTMPLEQVIEDALKMRDGVGKQ